ncbi:MAG: hypothetical protein UY60_C0026G0003 [Parcubacteria group bacterium GW2011_GWB1_50_9]|uniref:Uncharacterized protein n=1 Tax=Candidatus Giovannonibacteria bacterium GW2011_GWA2_45_21 TaxID=1618649 RepID=A0A0G1M6F9_9BACT|nr:MAG: hypothetical protein UX06_C0032G0014 [Candidatus Giovannonibacteria bacterium GW2011_GWA2_45_21]KKW17983.1 MAG: hypothetical protein UY60_C0026G0003 [Parcubacteria group bacterium GW2011_GWB1_50_9]
MLKIRNQKRVLNFGYCDFDIVSDLVLRISNL